MQRRINLIWTAALLLISGSISLQAQTVNIVSGSPQNSGTSSFGLTLSDPSGQHFGFQSAYDTYAGQITSGSTTYFTGFVGAYGYWGGNMGMTMAQGGAPTAAPGFYDFQIQRNGGATTLNCTGCFEISCGTPGSLASSNITGTTADISWLGSVYATSFVMEYGPSGFTQGTGTTVNTASNSTSVSGLTPGTAYQFYVRAMCSPGQYSGWASSSFSTTPLLNVVSGSPQVNTETAFGLVISDPSAQNFFLAGPTTTYLALITDGSTTYFTGLTDGFTYNGGNMSLNMTIAGGGTPSAGDYDVTLVKNGGVSNWTCEDCFQFISACPSFEELSFGNNGPYSSLGATVGVNEVVPPAGSVNDGCQTQDGWCNYNQSNEPGIQATTWYTFIAPPSGNVTLNTDLSNFDTQIAVYETTSCSELFDGTATFIGANDDNPNYINTEYSSELRLNCLTAGQTYYVQVDGFEGETGDVRINLTDNSGGAVITGNSNVSDHGMTINFLASAGGENRIIRYHEFGNSPNFSWNVLPAHRSSGYINGLSPYTRYTFRVGTRCAGENALYGDTATFWTRAVPCINPAASATVLENFATISWGSTGADYYKIRYRPEGGSWSYRHTGQTFVELENLVSGNYEWQIRAICNAGGNRPYNQLESFTIAPERLASVTSNETIDFNLYPNPSNGQITVDYTSKIDGNVSLNVIDLEGKLVFNEAFASQKGSNRIKLDLSKLEPGVYITSLVNQAGESDKIRIVLN